MGESEYAKQLNSVLNQDDQLLLLDAMGRAYHQVGNLEQSVVYNKEAILIINQFRATIPSERHRITFARYKDQIFNRLIDDLADQGQWEEAWKYAEQAKSRAFVDLLATRREIRFKDETTNQYAKDLKRKDSYI